MINLIPLSPWRVFVLRLFGARIGRGSVVHAVKFVNLYRSGFTALTIGDFGFIGNDVCLDLAGPLRLGQHVTLAERSMVLTHLNVGYADHPLQARFKSTCHGVSIGDGCFIGAGSIVLDGVCIERETFVAAMSLVNRNVPAQSFVAGVPAKPVS
jgi:putative colanic acid biosynthesis acetyltransferase WcaF